jgi:SAM-dependent methyltransferase
MPGGNGDNAYGAELSDAEIAAGKHREQVGGLWEQLGRLQFDFLVRDGLTPDARLLDVGCGCLRGGVHFVRYLRPGHYYGLDVNASLLRAGFEWELPQAGLAGRLPRENLLADGRFEAWRFGVLFDAALAQSLFTHLPAQAVHACLREVARCLRPGGRFYATFFEAPEGEATPELRHSPGDIVSFHDRDPYHYRPSELRALADGRQWDAQYVGEWGHPRAQRLLRFVRL